MGWSNQVERNLEAIEYEKDGEIDKAIKLYEENIAEDFEGTYPYERLAEIYLKSDQEKDLIRVLEKALVVFEDAELSDCQYKHTQLERFKEMYKNFTATLENI